MLRIGLCPVRREFGLGAAWQTGSRGGVRSLTLRRAAPATGSGESQNRKLMTICSEIVKTRRLPSEHRVIASIRAQANPLRGPGLPQGSSGEACSKPALS